VDEDFVAALDWIGGVREIVGGHALEHCSCGLLGADCFGDEDKASGGSYG
jgi:hypothetical protein